MNNLPLIRDKLFRGWKVFVLLISAAFVVFSRVCCLYITGVCWQMSLAGVTQRQQMRLRTTNAFEINEII